jgi:ATP-dependent protease HslVU (ClpYQ) peptidase subunit
MTTLVAIQGDGWSVMGCDSRLSDEHGRFQIAKTPKIVDNNGILIGGCGSSRASNVLHYGYVQPKPTIKEDLNTYMTQKFIPAMRKNFVDAGIDMKEDGDVAQIDGGFIISVKGQVFSVSEDYSWDTDVRNVYVMGSGGDVALGALAALGVEKVNTIKEAERMIRKAISIAIQYDNMCSQPIHIFTQHGNKEK